MPKLRPFPRTSWSVQGYSRNLLEGPVIDSDDIYRLIIRDRNGAPVFALVRIADDAFVQCDKSQPDWDAFCASRGIR